MRGTPDLSLGWLQATFADGPRHHGNRRKTIRVSKLVVITCLSLICWMPVAALIRVMAG